MKVFRQQLLQLRQIFLPLAEKALARPLKFLKCFIIPIIQNDFLEKLPVPFDQIQIRRIRRQKYQFDLRPLDILLQRTRTIVAGIINDNINPLGLRMLGFDFGEQING